MKDKIFTILKVLIIVLLVGWMVLFVVDYFRAKSGEKPFVCLKENTKTKGAESYYECISFGYKYFEYNGGGTTAPGYGFSAIFVKNEFEKKMEG